MRNRVPHSTGDLERNIGRRGGEGNDGRRRRRVSYGSYGALYVIPHFAVAVWRGRGCLIALGCIYKLVI